MNPIIQYNDEYRNALADINEEMVLFDGLDDAIIGYDMIGSRAIYDYDMCIELLMKNDSMTYEDAIEYFDFNVLCAYVGEYTPLFMNKIDNLL